MGGVSSAMIGLSVAGTGTSEGKLISKKTVDLVSAVYVPVAILMICYALFTYEWRSKFMHRKQVRAVSLIGLIGQHGLCQLCHAACATFVCYSTSEAGARWCRVCISVGRFQHMTVRLSLSHALVQLGKVMLSTP